MPAPPPESEPAMMRIRATGVIDAASPVLRGAKFSMRTGKSLRPQIPRFGSRGGLNGLADIVDQALDELGVVALGHHTDQRLRARLADDEAAPPFQLGFRGSDAFPDAVRFERFCAAVEAHVLQELRQRFELAQQFAR